MTTSDPSGTAGSPATTDARPRPTRTPASSDTTGSSEPPSGAVPADSFPIVGIGASAGGLAAFESFFSAIPQDVATGMAFVLVQHLAPDHKSILSDLVKRYTRMEVREVEDGMRVQPDCAYIIPPKMDIALFNDTLHLLEPAAPPGLRLPIDFFFRSLADEQHERAICVVLSGTGSDGTLGARAIKGEGGLVMVQSPSTAAYDGMPRSVIAMGLADIVLPPEQMPKRLLDYLAHPFGKRSGALPSVGKIEDALTKICLLLRDATRHDFSHYKQSTLVRRVERRMALHQIEGQDDYVRYLQHEPEESQALFRDLLIGLTRFFRDPEAFAALESAVIPALFAGKPPGAAVRVWICGCSSGEEAYSIAILVQEYLESLRQRYEVQIFATDVDPQAIAPARTGAYPASIATDLSPERLTRYFTLDTDAGVYRIEKVIRDLLVFSEQDLIRDPPFSRLDLISCRNLLIYLDGSLQHKIISLFHCALNRNGALLLGSSESIADAPMLFTPQDRKWKLYARLDQVSGAPAPTLTDLAPRHRPDAEPPPAAGAPSRAADTDLRALTEGALLQHFNAAGVLTNARGEISYIHGRTGHCLEPAAGTMSVNIFQMAREGLRRPLTNALQRAVTHQERVWMPGVKVKTNGDFTQVDLTIRPIRLTHGAEPGDGRAPLYLVILEQAASTPPEPLPETADEQTAASDPGRHRRIAELEQELRSKEEYLQSTLEEMETSNEELKSTNEEMQSVNEELQSTNEELETSKEELQSVNEELATVNAELQVKVADLSRANDDMNNLLAGTGVATLFVDDQRRISRYTPAMTQILKLIPGDIGRPVGDLVSNLVDYIELVEDIERVLRTLAPREKVVQTKDGTWFLMRIGPYRTLSNVIEGAVMTFVDISAHKRMEEELRGAQAFAEGVVDAVREPLMVLDEAGVLVSANRAFYRHFQVSEAETLGRPLFALGNGQWDSPALRQLLERLDSPGTRFDDYRVEHDFPNLGPRVVQLNARRLSPISGQVGAILIAVEDLGRPIRALKDDTSTTDAARSAGGGHDPADR